MSNEPEWKQRKYKSERDTLDRARSCDGKEQLDHAAAEARVHKLKKKNPRGTLKLCAYQCRHCSKWHVGNVRPGCDR